MERAGGLYAWEFAKRGQELRVWVDGQLTFNSSYTQVEAALRGYGIAYVPENIMKAHIAWGDRALVLDDWSPTFDGHHIYHPSRRQNSPAFKVIVDALRHRGK
ncbi:DNA-binding transcriptional LysR family regulator [Bradyrhizobium ottawaense]|uniref:DNA-binding transcriptional LysR family regulator n=1 Tax=Bradyrhizobium ottawaense TaxID=931866 RepID=A0ABV4FJ41_9BRAD|nr:hypothetical protein SG09_30770 [Bradyrhizobium ottawaense]GMO17401.1 hypothetical protein BwSH14_07920 [Bradyrhizobium ottawaense]GMO30027.1 hypothetical protein BwSF12_27940 [Bradyrhizobium ottawaense]GMO36053.1 hypothetical protein BwSF21_43240 [Bradyrhizobium ottawaense]GMO67076.1 hypothetical protein BwSG20_28410 [Bradyrhizobium ottawaense]